MNRLLALGVCFAAVVSAVPVLGQGPGDTTPRARVQGATLPGTRVMASSTIQGSAIDAADRPVALNRVRLRDARLGGIVSAQLTDSAGVFSFGPLDPGTYMVELVDNANHTVIATSQLLNLAAGETRTTLLRLPSSDPAMGWRLSHVLHQAAAVAAAAAASGVLAQTVTGTDASPR